MLIKYAAAELVKEEFEGRRMYPYAMEWRFDRTLLFFGPTWELDWLEGVRLDDRDQLLCVSFRSWRCGLHIYDRYKAVLGIGNDKVLFEYANPAFPQNLFDMMDEIIDHHAMLHEIEKDEYNQFRTEMRRQGKPIITANDIPENRFPSRRGRRRSY